MVMEMVSDYWLAVLSGLLIGSAITAVGMYLLGFRRVRRGGRTVLVPEIDRRPMAQRWREFRHRLASEPMRPRTFVIVLTVIVLTVLGGLIQTTTFTWEQRRCNAEFQRTIAERAAVNADSEQARKENDNAVANLVRGLLNLPPNGDNREASRALLAEFDQTVRDNAQRQFDNELKRAANPYPEC